MRKIFDGEIHIGVGDDLVTITNNRAQQVIGISFARVTGLVRDNVGNWSVQADFRTEDGVKPVVIPALRALNGQYVALKREYQAPDHTTDFRFAVPPRTRG